MKRIPIQSGELISIGYDAELQILEIEFSDHDVYQFVEVSAEIYSAFMNASDLYQYFKAHIDAKFLCRKL